jgi:hypothetical protein
MSKSGLKRVDTLRGISRRIKRGFMAIPLSLTLLGSIGMPNANAADSDDTGFYGSVTIQRAAQAAATAMKKGAYGEAQGEYRKAIGFDPNQEDFYFGLYESSFKMQQWDQVALALEELFTKNPKFKDQMLLEYGECLFHLNRYDEAEPILKKALAKVAEPSVVDIRIKRLMEKSIIVKAPEVGTIIAYKEPEKFVAPERRGKLDAEEVHESKSKKSLTFLNAWMKCEGVFVAEYKGYETDGPVSFFKPPQANFRIIEYLKGPPLSRTFPVKYEFHEKLGEERPKDWKFSEEMMPKKGSKWLIFVPNCVPIDGKFETFHGSFGRQEYTDKVIDEIHKIIQEHQGATKL